MPHEDFDGADRIFAEMREMKIKPKRISYLRFINGCFKAKEAERAYGKLQRARARARALALALALTLTLTLTLSLALALTLTLTLTPALTLTLT